MKMTQGHRMMITTHFHDSAVWPPRPLIFSMLDVVWFLFTVWCNRKGVIWFRRRHWGNEGNSTYKWPPGKQNINKHTFALTSCLLIPWVFNSRNSIKGCEIFRPNCLCMHPIMHVPNFVIWCKKQLITIPNVNKKYHDWKLKKAGTDLEGHHLACPLIFAKTVAHLLIFAEIRHLDWVWATGCPGFSS